MQHPNQFTNGVPIGRITVPVSDVTPLSPCEMVTDAMLRDLAALDPLRIADGEDKVMLAGLSMSLPEICAELLARRHAMEKGQRGPSRKGR